MNLKLNNKIISAAFIAAEAILSVLIQILSGTVLDVVSFSAVALALVYVILQYRYDPVWQISAIALTFTVLADVCLVLISARLQLLGMCFFSVTQLAYFARTLNTEESLLVRRIHLVVRVVILVAASATTVAVLGDGADALSVISVIYYANLLLNVLFSFISLHGGVTKTRLMLSIGLVCFALCDLFVGMSCIEAYIPLTEGTFWHFLAYPPFNIAWLFYVPSQTLLALSTAKQEKIPT